MRIKVITHAFGPFPRWLPFTLRTMGWNPDIEWIIVTDQQYAGEIPPNVKFQHTTLQILSEVAGAETGIEFPPISGYKVCDWRPAFGLIFREMIGDADFWGHCDLDCFYGRVRHFYTDDIFAGHQVVSSEWNEVSGPLSFYANTEAVNNLFRQLPDYQCHLRDPEFAGCDEKRIRWVMEGAGVRLYLPPKERCHIYSETCQVARCSDGKVTAATGEAVFIHFRGIKARLRIIADLGAVTWSLDGNILLPGLAEFQRRMNVSPRSYQALMARSRGRAGRGRAGRRGRPSTLPTVLFG